MKKIISLVALSILITSPFVSAGEYLNLEERQAKLCNKTSHGKHMKSGWEWDQQSASTCDRVSGTYTEGKKKGKTYDRRVTGYDNGEVCVHLENGKESCNKAKAMDDGTVQLFATNGKWKGQHVVTISNIKDVE